jgi:hypothetical protein
VQELEEINNFLEMKWRQTERDFFRYYTDLKFGDERLQTRDVATSVTYFRILLITKIL